MKVRALARLVRSRLSQLPATGAVLVVATLVEVGLRTMSLPRLAALAGTPLQLEDPESSAVKFEPAPDDVFELPPRARRQLAATRRVLRHWPFGDTCLRQALISGQRLRRFQPRLQVGVAKLNGEVRAHAWLLIHGRILDPMGVAVAYLPLNSIPTGLKR